MILRFVLLIIVVFACEAYYLHNCHNSNRQLCQPQRMFLVRDINPVGHYYPQQQNFFLSSWSYYPQISVSSSLLMIKKNKRKGGSSSSNNGIGFGNTKKEHTKNDVDRIQLTTTTFTSKDDIATSVTESRKLDKWGLPIPTIDDIFPPLASTTIIIPALVQKTDNNHDIISYLQSALRGNRATEIQEDDEYALISHHLSHIFDEKGIEKLNLRNMTSPPYAENGDVLLRKRLHDLPPMKIKCMHHTPPIFVIENFLSSKECDTILQMTKHQKHKYDDGNNNIMQVNSATLSLASISKRTSTSWFCSYEMMPIFINRVKQLLNCSINQMEEPQIVRYQSNQCFDYHYDIIPASQCHNGGQRIATLLVYLNTLPSHAGGRTIFRDLKNPIHHHDRIHDSNGTITNNDNKEPLAVQPIQGNAILFFPSNRNGIPDDRTLHQGEIVRDNMYEKYIIQMWIHQYPNYTASLPSVYNDQSKCPIL